LLRKTRLYWTLPLKPNRQTQSLQRILYSQGFGSRRVCAGLIEAGHVEISSQAAIEPLGPDDEFITENLRFRVNGVEWPYCEKAYIVLHKPGGTECSQKPVNHPSIYSLLPGPLRDRPNPGGTPGVQAVGRLDQDTTGLLLLSDDGKFIHRMSSPKHHVPKIYEVTTKHEITAEQIAHLVEGVVLDDDPAPVRAAACVARAETHVSLTLTEGKYHQVKRMIAAVGNRVEALHRSQIGGYVLPAALAPGQWRWLDKDDLNQIIKTARA
jgi:16S rRNA pseudouridine516 synthase